MLLAFCITICLTFLCSASLETQHPHIHTPHLHVPHTLTPHSHSHTPSHTSLSSPERKDERSPAKRAAITPRRQSSKAVSVIRDITPYYRRNVEFNEWDTEVHNGG